MQLIFNEFHEELNKYAAISYSTDTIGLTGFDNLFASTTAIKKSSSRKITSLLYEAPRMREKTLINSEGKFLNISKRNCHA